MFELVILLSGVIATICMIMGWDIVPLRFTLSALLVIYAFSCFPYSKEDRRKKGLIVGAIVFFVSGMTSILASAWWPILVGIVCGFGLAYLLTTEKDYTSMEQSLPRSSLLGQAAKAAIKLGGSIKTQREVAQRIDNVVQLATNKVRDGEHELTLTRLETIWIVIAQSIGLFVWEYYGKKLSQPKCITLAQSLLLLELEERKEKLVSGDRYGRWYDEVILGQQLAMQASTPIVLCFMGAENMARDNLKQISKILALHDDDAMRSAVNQASK